MLATSLGGGTLFAAADWVRPVDVLPFVLPGQAITAPLVVVTYAPQAFGQAGQAADRMVELLVTLPLAEPEQPFTAAGHRRRPSTTSPTTWRVTSRPSIISAEAGRAGTWRPH
ncbi:hypothetical protein [Streptomyces sp. NPDC059278]|uniref:hypothetical protein n=1 Tax=Streptomyces sp. NPDC059278 TaxID=3346801 RepID=UPI0036C4CE85